MHWIDPESLPEIAGTLEQFVLNPHGEIDGFLMQSGKQVTLVHAPPHLHDELSRHLKPGEEVRVRAVRPRGAALLDAVAVTGENGRQIVDDGPDHDREHPKVEHRQMTAEGVVRVSLFGPKGELRGAVLMDGMSVRIGPKEAENCSELLAPGASVAVRGEGLETKYGRVIHAREIGDDLNELRPVKDPKHKAPAKGRPGSEAHTA
jgi:hypothetical protein